MSRVLLVTLALTARTGTEVVCAETAHALRRRGHTVSIYTQQDGTTADSLRADGFEVVSDIAALQSVPEVIQANQTLPLLDAAARFPGVPAISVCHDSRIWFSEPIDLPSIRLHAAVDFACRDRIARRLPHAAGQIEILPNAVDLDRFVVRAPLPVRPRRALMLAKHANCVDAVREACSRHGLDIEAAGPAVGNEVVELPPLLREYDLVFASARSALEAMAVGCAVIVVDGRGLAGLAMHENVASWRENNFGLRTLSRDVSAEAIAAEIARYDAGDALAVRDVIRAQSSLDSYMDQLEAIHRRLIDGAHAQPIETHALPEAMARAFRAITDARDGQTQEYMEASARAAAAPLQAEIAALNASLMAKDAEIAALNASPTVKDAEIAAYRDRATLRHLPRRIARLLRIKS
jgi:hypothetical protein